MTDTAIGDYAFLSDCHSAALVDRAGSVDWLCFPRFDSPSVFGRLLDRRTGHWSVTPVDVRATHRRYLADSLVVRNEFTTATGRVALSDALALDPGERGHNIGRGAPHTLLRRAECLDGWVELDVDYAPRPEYGIGQPLLRQGTDTITTRGGPDHLVLTSSHPLQVERSSARGRVRLGTGDALACALTWSRSWEVPPAPCPADEVDGRLADTVTGWRSWAAQHQHFDGPLSQQVRLAGIVLQGLTFQPTGAIAAAATTSLPEADGAGRNWDYRYGWIRDASLTLDALWVAACPDEAGAFLDWLVGAAAANLGDGRSLQIMYGVGGEHDLSERDLDHLEGWRGNRPVRIGNGAWQQRQLDVYGELLGAVHRLRDQIGPLDAAQRDFLISVADAAAASWQLPDQGIWELRGPPQHHLYSKLMCWVALDRAVALADRLGARRRAPAWSATAGRIKAAILSEGYNHRAEAFTQAFGSEVIDASALMVPIVGLLPGDDPRVTTTITAVEHHLRDEHGLVHRYQDGTDGLHGHEGAFVMCSFWLAHAHALAGATDDAAEVFDRVATGAANDLGLMAEQIGDGPGELLGNYPQAFSHVGLVAAAEAIAASCS